jgi:hypothetical protein
MTSKKKLVKKALQNPEMYSPAEISYFRLWLREMKEKAKAKKSQVRLTLERIFLQ